MLNILNELAATTKTNEKLAILQKYESDHLVATVFRLAYSPTIKYWIKKRPEPVDVHVGSVSDLYTALLRLVHDIAEREITGNAAIEFVGGLLYNLNPDDREVLYRIIERDLKCGVNVKLINKVWKDLIPEYPVLLCGKFNEKTEKNIKYPALFQCKMDSSRINLEFDNGKFVSASRVDDNGLYVTEPIAGGDVEAGRKIWSKIVPILTVLDAESYTARVKAAKSRTF